uniref:IFA binding protein n=1 Tax=Lilium longiflorum TaxID=4690 RepID=A6MGY3_LILLO|nr:IFA binding protein [Lilium longiflorum]
MARRAPSREQKDQCRLTTLLSSAFFEWLLIILLFIAAILSYLATRLARFCKLQTPCLLCSRLDHIWGNEKAGFYKDLLCHTHKLEMASLGYCHIHRKLGDVHKMCESCLRSFAKKKTIDEGENARTKLPVTLIADGLRNKYYGEDMVKVPLLKNDLEPRSLSTRYCSCCSEAFRGKPSESSLLKWRPIEGDIVESGKTGHSHVQHVDGLSKRKGKSSQSPPIRRLCNFGFDRLSHVGYSELKINSDSESEIPFSDDDDGTMRAHGIEDLKEEVMSTVTSKDVSTTFSDDIVREKLIHPMVPEQSLIALEKQHASEYNSKPPIGSNVTILHGLDEINWNHVEARENHSAPDFIPEQNLSEAANAKYVMQIGDATKALSSTDMNSKRNPTMNDPNALGQAYMANSPPLPSTEIVTGKEAAKIHEDLRLLLSQISAARGLEFLSSELSPSPRLSNASSTTGSQSNSKRYEGNESSLESLYGIVSEVEGESPVDRLKRQIEFDRKSLTSLFKELEEERSASAIAANQAMAMINRLQEEKAAMQMEAWQYQRMMEEQAEYDQEALEKLNDILAEREKDIQDLEAEIDNYRKRFGEEALGDLIERDLSRNSTPRATRSSSRQNSCRTMEPGYTPSRFLKDSLMDIEDEKAYMLQCLKRLEKKLQMFSGDSDDGLPPAEDKVSGVDHEYANGQSEELVEADEVVFEKNKSSFSSEDLTALASQNLRDKRLLYSSSNNSIQYPMIGKTNDVIVLGDEVSQLNERLEALEADRDFLDRALNSIKNGNDGVQFIREIACHLRELRRIGIRLRKNMVI